MAEIPRPWVSAEPGFLMGRGHPAGDFLEAWDWRILEEHRGYLRIDAPVPSHVLNPRGQLFGGFTPTYVDLVTLHTVRAGPDRLTQPRRWLATTNMRIDYLRPVVGPRVVMTSEVVSVQGKMHFVQTRFLDREEEILVMALTTMKEIEAARALGDG